MRFILLFLCTNLFCQEYVPLLDNHNEWQVTNCFFGCLTDGYYTDGDTLVGGYDYKILDGYHYISRTFLLREDVTDRKVYLNFVEETIDNEYLLYDFSMEVGDSIDMKNPISPFIENAGYYGLDSIVPKPLVDGNEYRHFYFSPSESNTISTNNAIWVEGAGSLSIINAPSGDPDINGAGHLSCSYKNGNYFYSNLDSIDSCEPIILDNHDRMDPFSEIIISTDTTLNTCQLTNIENIKLVDVYDMNGRRIISFNINNEASLIFNTDAYDTGIYFLVAYTKQFKKKTFKIVVE